jgi:hypothetical protein
MKPIMELIVALFVILVFDIITLRWGFKSGDGWNNPEWVRRQNWKDFLWYRCCKDSDWVPDLSLASNAMLTVTRGKSSKAATISNRKNARKTNI